MAKKKYTWGTPVARALLKHQGGKDPEAVVQRLSNKLVESLGRTEPPFQTDEFEFASLVGANVIENKISAAGMLTCFKGKIVIEVNQYETAVMKNYTVCHEVGHIEIRRAANLRDFGRHGVPIHFESSKEEERLAEVFACNLLMPAKSYEERAAKRPPSLTSLRELASEYRVSIDTAARRVLELHVWKCVIIWGLPIAMGINGDEWAVKLDECRSSKISCPPRSRDIDLVWWAGEIVRDAYENSSAEGVVTILGEKWRVEAMSQPKRTGHGGCKRRVMGILVPQ